MRWHVSEMDIEFDSTRNWYFGTGSPASNQFDFESVATHELGHGHQLGHVRDNAKVMHFSISNGQRKPELVATDIAAGNYISNKSITTAVCNRNSMIAGLCPSIPPSAGFSSSATSVCPGENITFTNSTSGQVTLLTWNFGADASQVDATGEGPHTVSYSSGGSKMVRLIATNLSGSDTFTQSITIKPGEIAQPDSFVLQDTICTGVERYTIAAVDGATSYQWSVASGGNIIEDGITTIRVDWKDTGVHQVSVLAQGECVDSEPREEDVFVLSVPTASFSSTTNGLTASFANTSTYVESYFWDFGDGAGSTEKEPSHKYGDKGTYTVQLTTANRCDESETTEEVLVAFGASVAELQKELVVYPNPVRRGGKIELSAADFTSYELYGTDGKIALKGTLPSGVIELNNTAAGVFMLVLHKGDLVVRHKITIIE